MVCDDTISAIFFSLHLFSCLVSALEKRKDKGGTGKGHHAYHSHSSHLFFLSFSLLLTLYSLFLYFLITCPLTTMKRTGVAKREYPMKERVFVGLLCILLLHLFFVLFSPSLMFLLLSQQAGIE